MRLIVDIARDFAIVAIELLVLITLWLVLIEEICRRQVKFSRSKKLHLHGSKGETLALLVCDAAARVGR